MRMCAEDLAIPMTIIENYTTCDLQCHDALLAFSMQQAEYGARSYQGICGR